MNCGVLWECYGFGDRACGHDLRTWQWGHPGASSWPVERCARGDCPDHHIRPVPRFMFSTRSAPDDILKARGKRGAQALPRDPPPSAPSVRRARADPQHRVSGKPRLWGHDLPFCLQHPASARYLSRDLPLLSPRSGRSSLATGMGHRQ